MKALVLLGALLASPSFALDVKTFTIENSSVSSGLRVTGRIVPEDGSVYIESARLTGRVLTVLVKEGDVVSPGKALLEINSAECQSVALEKKSAQARGLPDLLDAVTSRERQLGLRARSTSCEIIATHAGVIMKKVVEAGSTFNPGDNLFTLVNRQALTVELEVPERDADKIKVGLPVVVVRPASPEKSYETKVKTVIPSLSAVTRTLRVRLEKIKFDGNPSLDEFVFGEIRLGGQGVLFKVPSAAVVFDGKIDQLYKLTKGKPPVAVNVEVASQAEGHSFVREVVPHSLQVGDTIAAEGAVFLSRDIKRGGK